MDEYERHDGDYGFGIPDDMPEEEAERLGFIEWNNPKGANDGH